MEIPALLPEQKKSSSSPELDIVGMGEEGEYGGHKQEVKIRVTSALLFSLEKGNQVGENSAPIQESVSISILKHGDDTGGRLSLFWTDWITPIFSNKQPPALIEGEGTG